MCQGVRTVRRGTSSRRQQKVAPVVIGLDISLLALFVALAALVFTVLSFWWIHERPGRLRLASIPGFAGMWRRRDGVPELTLRLPVMLNNTGARARVVEELRLFVPGWHGEAILEWEHIAETLDPSKGAALTQDFPSPYAIDPRRTSMGYVDFTSTFSGPLPTAGPTTFVLQARLDGRDRWEEAGRITLHLGHMRYPEVFIYYRNSETLCPGETNEGTSQAWAQHLGAVKA